MLTCLVIAICLIFGASYFANTMGGSGISCPSPLFSLILYCVTYFLYIKKYRNNNIICFESLFLIVSGICYFFNILLPNSDFFGYSPSTDLKNKAISLEMLSTGFFYLGCMWINRKHTVESELDFVNGNLKIGGSWIKKAVSYISIITLFYFFFLNYSGQLQLWFIYSTAFEDNDAWQSINNMAYLLNLLTILEFFRLYELRIHSFKDFLRNVNKLFLFVI